MMAFLPLKRHPFKLVDINGTIVIDVSDLYNILEALGASSLEPLPGSQDTLFLPPSLWTDVPSLLYHLLKMKHTHTGRPWCTVSTPPGHVQAMCTHIAASFLVDTTPHLFGSLALANLNM